MPDHDVDVTIACRSGMINNPGIFIGHQLGLMGMVDNMNNGNQPDRATAYDKPIENNGSEWTCPLCGSTNTGRFCCECGGAKPQPDEPLNPEDMLISISTYMSTNPPVNTYVKVYKHSDTQLLLDCNGKRRMIPADVLESAMEIIRKYRLDDPDFKDPSAMGIMGGSVYVGFKDGDRFVQTSLQTQGFAVTNAENELMGLFNKCK